MYFTLTEYPSLPLIKQIYYFHTMERLRSLDVVENGQNILWKKHPIQQYVKFGFPRSSVSKESACNAGDPGSIPGSGRPTRNGIGYPLQYSWASLVAQLVKNLPAMWINLGSITGLGRSTREGNFYAL